MDTRNPTTNRIRASLDVTEFLEPVRTKSQEQVDKYLGGGGEENRRSSYSKLPPPAKTNLLREREKLEQKTYV